MADAKSMKKDSAVYLKAKGIIIHESFLNVEHREALKAKKNINFMVVLQEKSGDYQSVIHHFAMHQLVLVIFQSGLQL